MIGVRLSGGLGNQLFQYAAGRALACSLGTELVLDVSAFGRVRPGETPRAFALGWLHLHGRLSGAGRMALAGRLRRAPWLARWLTPWQVAAERGLTFNEGFAGLGEGTLLVGYWQSYRYFEDHAATIAQDLVPALPLSAHSRRLADMMQACESVAVHVRRGDYVTLQAAAALHGVLPLGYYEAALAQVHQLLASPRLFVFSDDPAWCQAQLPWPQDRMTVVAHNTGEAAWQDLVLMGHCRHHVIANSSFSWWGAWLADQRYGSRRHVMAPAQWFAGQAHDTTDRFPPSWTTLKVPA